MESEQRQALFALSAGLYALCALLSLLLDPDFHAAAAADPGQCMAM